jgi:hypothetical protein
MEGGFRELHNGFLSLRPKAATNNFCQAKSLNENCHGGESAFHSKFSRPSGETDIILEPCFRLLSGAKK